MAIFERADPDVQAQKAAEAALRAKRRDRDGLVERLGTAEAAAISYCNKARESAANGGDDAAISKLEAQMRSSQDRALTLAGAIGDVDKTIDELERTIDRIIDKRCRSETSIAVDAMADRIAKAQVAHEAAALELELAAKEGGLLIPEARAVYEFTRSLREQLKPANEMIVGALKGHARGVLDGHYPASLPRPAPPPVKLAVVPSEPMMTLYVTKNIRYLDASGATVCCGQNRRHDLPAHIGKLALDAGAAITLSEDKKRIQAFECSNGMLVPLPENCMWIGKPGKPDAPRLMRPGGAPIHSQFEPMDRGKPYVATFSRPPEPEPLAATGTRAMPEDGES
jgi:predicted transcriptional regulator